MSPPKDTIWPLEPHTAAKIEIVRNYLGPWLAILSSYHKRIIYVDAFAGPGLYVGQKKGSPVIALETALYHQHDLSGTEIIYNFIDDRADRIEHLISVLQQYNIPKHIKYDVIQGKFNDTINQVLDELGQKHLKIAPTFMFIDPFGISDTPFQTIERFMRNERCEVLVNFQYQSVNRFKSILPQHMDDLFGTNDWCKGEKIADSAEREQFLVGLYIRQLQRVAKYTWSFRMIDWRNKTTYYLIFGTNHKLGLERMKEAMWRVSASTDYSFSNRRAGQLTLFKEDVTPLRNILITQFSGQTVNIDEIEDFVLIDTDYLKSHVKQRNLGPLEREGLIEVVESPRKRRSGYPPGTIIKFS